VSKHPLEELAASVGGRRRGITSICSAHPFVIAAALSHAAEHGGAVLIEATCNQVNHEGGYTGMTPVMFRDLVLDRARSVGLPRGQILLGGDHLGPNPWKSLPADQALRRAEIMIAAYVEAGFTKIHLDTSMGCEGEPAALPEAVTATRAARLAVAAEAAAARCGNAPRYVIGTEVPIPGGALEAIETLDVTRPEAALRTHRSHRAAFEAAGIGAAFARVMGLVVQPGVEFGSENVVAYAREPAAALSAALRDLPGLVFEAHSTDYQALDCLSALVQDGFAILKVGPRLTFAMREALYALDAIAGHLHPGRGSLIAAMESLMLDHPANWAGYYVGSEVEQRVSRHFSYSDRIRYYWPLPPAQRAVEQLLELLEGTHMPETLVSQHLPRLYERVRSGKLGLQPRALVAESIKDVLRDYAAACA
jgi:D-tagatose-1,6-bisphosphate aldolase subunit GatZ/KbaZ